MPLQPYTQRIVDGVPMLRKWVVNAGKADKIWASPCEVEPEILVQAFFHELPILIWALTKPDPIDAAAADATNRRRGGLHDRKRRQKKGPIFRFRAGSLIPGELRYVSGVPTWAFKLASLAQRVGWYFLVVDATQEFLIRWGTTTMQWAGCIPVAYWQKGFVDDVWTPAGGSGTFASPFLMETQNSTPNTFVGTTITQPAGTDIVLKAWMQLGRAQFTVGQWPTSCWIQHMETGTRHYLFDGLIVGGDNFPTGELSIFREARKEQSTWRVMIQSDQDRVIANPISYFTGYPPTNALILSDPP